jgi:hypothetical protein
MVTGLILIEGLNVMESDLNLGLSNAKHQIIGRSDDFGIIVHIAATTPKDFNKALLDFGDISNVKGVVPLILRKEQ